MVVVVVVVFGVGGVCARVAHDSWLTTGAPSESLNRWTWLVVVEEAEDDFSVIESEWTQPRRPLVYSPPVPPITEGMPPEV